MELVGVGAKACVATGGDVAAFAIADASKRSLENLVEILDNSVDVAGTARDAVIDDEFADPTTISPAVVGSTEVVWLDAEGVRATMEETGLEGEPEGAVLEFGGRRCTAVEAELEDVGHEFMCKVEAGECAATGASPGGLMTRTCWAGLEPPAAAAADQKTGETIAAIGAEHASAAFGAVSYSGDGVLFEVLWIGALKQKNFGVARWPTAEHTWFLGRVAVDCAEGVRLEETLGAVSSSYRGAAAVTGDAWIFGFKEGANFAAVGAAGVPADVGLARVKPDRS